MRKGAICPNGHRSDPIGARCRTVLRSKAECGERVMSEPLVRSCQRCHRGIYAQGHCSFCGHVDPETREEAQVYQNGTPESQTALQGPQNGREGQ